jgi:hypothetical protein
MSSISYNYDYEVTYGNYMNKIADDDAYEMMINESLYREQLLEVFGLDKRGDFDDDHINKQIELLFHICKQYTPMMEIIEYVSERHPLRMMITDEDSMIVGFMVLFSYDLFYLTHKCVQYIFRAGSDEIKEVEKVASAKGYSGNSVVFEISPSVYEPAVPYEAAAAAAAASSTSHEVSNPFTILKRRITETM